MVHVLAVNTLQRRRQQRKWLSHASRRPDDPLDLARGELISAVPSRFLADDLQNPRLYLANNLPQAAVHTHAQLRCGCTLPFRSILDPHTDITFVAALPSLTCPFACLQEPRPGLLPAEALFQREVAPPEIGPAAIKTCA
jgi:hypothetical protein